jgi:DNA-directed RNA polymerase specialized sigma24 family protein
MLEKLAENHKKWVQIAYNLCKCKDIANDIVQDMYIKMYELGKEVDEAYIYFVIRSIFFDTIRKQKEFVYDTGYLKWVTDVIEFKNHNIDFQTELKRKCFDVAYSKLEKHEKVIMHFS